MRQPPKIQGSSLNVDGSVVYDELTYGRRTGAGVNDGSVVCDRLGCSPERLVSGLDVPRSATQYVDASAICNRETRRPCDQRSGNVELARVDAGEQG